MDNKKEILILKIKENFTPSNKLLIK